MLLDATHSSFKSFIRFHICFTDFEFTNEYILSNPVFEESIFASLYCTCTKMTNVIFFYFVFQKIADARTYLIQTFFYKQTVCYNPVANRFVHCLATLSCSGRFCRYCVAMLPTRGSEGLQSVNNEHIDSKTFDIVRAGLQLSFKMSRHITPLLFMLQW